MTKSLDQSFGLTNVQTACDDIAGNILGLLQPDQTAGMASGQAALGQMVPHRFWQDQKAEGIGHMTAALANGTGKLLLGVLELIHQPRIGIGLFHRIEIFAL